MKNGKNYINVTVSNFALGCDFDGKKPWSSHENSWKVLIRLI